MSVTYVNQKALPAPLSDAITFSDFIPDGHLSAGKLIDAPQIAYLKRHHNLNEDVSEKTWALINKALVQVIENGDKSQRTRRAFSNVSKALIEIQSSERMSTAEDKKSQEWMDGLGNIIEDLDTLVQEYFPAERDRYLIRQSYGVRLTETYTAFKGTAKEVVDTREVTLFDTIPVYDRQERTLYYTRICNTFHATKPEMRRHWERESNVQAYILQQNGMPVDKVAAVMIFKDWSMGMVGNRKDYPESQVEVVALALHPMEKTEQVIRVRLRQHLRQLMGDVAPCPPSDRWAEETMFVVKRKGSTRVLKKGFSRDEVVTWLAQSRITYNDAFVDEQPGRSKRCETFCPVRDVCPQWKAERERMLQKPPEEDNEQ